jgi:hypothetical protein
MVALQDPSLTMSPLMPHGLVIEAEDASRSFAAPRRSARFGRRTAVSLLGQARGELSGNAEASAYLPNAHSLVERGTDERHAHFVAAMFKLRQDVVGVLTEVRCNGSRRLD